MESILITGATSGIGRACAEYLAEGNYKVFATGRNEKAIQELNEAAGARKWDLRAFRMDVTDEESIGAAVDRVLELTGGRGLDVLVNNAGYELPGFLTDLTVEQAKQQFDVNVFGPLAVTKQFLPQLMANKAKVINIGSMSGKLAAPWSGIYCTTKAAVTALNDIMRVEFGMLGVKVFIVEPGHIETNFHETAIAALEETISQDGSLFAPTHAWLKEHSYEPFFASAAIEPVEIAKLLEQIIAGKKRKSRYVIPLKARGLMLLSTTLPNTLSDMIMRRLFHLYESRV